MLHANRNIADRRDRGQTSDGAQGKHVSSGVQRTSGDRLLLAATPQRHCPSSDDTGRRDRPDEECQIPIRGRRAIVRPMSRGDRRGVHVRHGSLALRPRLARRSPRDVRHGGRHGFRYDERILYIYILYCRRPRAPEFIPEFSLLSFPIYYSLLNMVQKSFAFGYT